MAAVAVFRWHKYTSLNKVIPSEDLLGPQLECIQEFKVGAISKRQLLLTKRNEAVYGFVIVVNTGVCDKRINSIHLH